MRTRKSWREKLERLQEPRLVAVPEKMAKRLGKGTMLIPRPLDVDALMRKIRKGKLATQSLMRERLARDFGADVTYPITTGIFVRIAAEAAEEQWRAGKKRVTPYWRVVRDDGSFNPHGQRGRRLRKNSAGRPRGRPIVFVIRRAPTI